MVPSPKKRGRRKATQGTEQNEKKHDEEQPRTHRETQPLVSPHFAALHLWIESSEHACNGTSSFHDESGFHGDEGCKMRGKGAQFKLELVVIKLQRRHE